MSWARIREAVGKVWGQTTTLLLTVGMAVEPVIQSAAPSLQDQAPWIKWILLGLAVGMALLRVIAPPPPAVPIHIDDQVVVDHEAGVVTIAKAAAIPAGVTTKAAGEKV